MSLSIEELLRPRYKVIADYPNQYLPSGRIIDNLFYDDEYKDESFFDEYPAIFKKMGWWEDRNESDMPEYVKFYLPLPKKYSIGKVLNWMPKTNGDMWVSLESDPNQNIVLGREDFPATLEEYNAFKSSKL